MANGWGRSTRERFMDKVYVSSSGCHIYTGAIDGYGRGSFRDGDKTVSVKGLAFRLSGLDLPRDTVVINCENDLRCVNPEHLDTCSRTVNVVRTRGSLSERFFAHVDKMSGLPCHLWTGVTSNGYGTICESRRRYLAHRVALAIWAVGENTSAITGWLGDESVKGLQACHKCNNPLCVNFLHLYLGFPAQNVADAVRSGSIRFGRESSQYKHGQYFGVKRRWFQDSDGRWLRN